VKQLVVENLIIGSPFREPGRHLTFTDEGITNEVRDGRSSTWYFVPSACPARKVRSSVNLTQNGHGTGSKNRQWDREKPL
jgi:hypothetical protein